MLICLQAVSRPPPQQAIKRDKAGARVRRSELVGLDVWDLKFVPAALQVRIRGSNTDQENKGHVIGIARGESACPVKAVRAWLKTAETKSGPLFRSIS